MKESSKNMFFSIVIPTYNHAHYINRCLDSLISQTYPHWEAIIVNNYSVDNTIELIETYKDSRIKIINFKNSGIIGASRNIGIKNAKYDWIAFLDSDDSWYPNKLEECLKELDSADLIYHDLEMVSKNSDDKKSDGMYMKQVDKDAFRDLYFNGNVIPNSSVVARKTLLQKAGGFAEDKSLVAIEDYDLWLRLALQKTSFKHVHQILGIYNYGDGSISYNLKNSLERELLIVNKYKGQVTPAEKTKIINSRCIETVVKMLRVNKRFQSIPILIKVLRNKPDRKHFIQAWGYLLLGGNYKKVAHFIKG